MMGIRIISGEFRGRRIDVDDIPGLRPTTDRVRETIFNILAHRVEFEGIRVLDLFAGSGALGIEAMSRGADHVDFVERGGRGVSLIRANLAGLSASDRGNVLRGDVFRLAERLGRYDLVLADPPYTLREIPELVAIVPELLAPEGYFLLERGYPSSDILVEGLDLVDDRKAGKTRLSLYRSELHDNEIDNRIAE